MNWRVACAILTLVVVPAREAMSQVLPARAPASPVASPSSNVARWEYKVTIYNRVAVFGDSDHEMRLLGLLGWELVSTTYDPHARTIVCFYKRPLGIQSSIPSDPGLRP